MFGFGKKPKEVEIDKDQAECDAEMEASKPSREYYQYLSARAYSLDFNPTDEKVKNIEECIKALMIDSHIDLVLYAISHYTRMQNQICNKISTGLIYRSFKEEFRFDMSAVELAFHLDLYGIHIDKNELEIIEYPDGKSYVLYKTGPAHTTCTARYSLICDSFPSSQNLYKVCRMLQAQEKKQ